MGREGEVFTMMRVTSHNGRKGKSGVYSVKHNDRNFDEETAEHINTEKSKDNVYWNCYNDNTLTFEQAELKFYEENFSKMLADKNERYLKQRHPERVQTMQEMIKNEKFCPEEMLFYVGNKDKEVGKDKLLDIFKDFKKWHDKEFPNVKTLDYALHADERGAKHIHWRKVWTATDKYGDLTVGQNKALEEMNIQAPDPSKKITKKNNAKITYSAKIREKLFEICKNHGVEIEKSPKEKSKVGLELIEFQVQQEQEKLEKLQEKTAKYANVIALSRHDEDMLDSIANQVEHKTKTLSRKDYVEMSEANFNRLMSISRHGVESNVANLSLKNENLELKRENSKLKTALSDERKRAFEKLGGENEKLKEQNSKLTKDNKALKSQNHKIGQLQKQATFLKNFIQENGQTKEFNEWYKGLPNNVKEAQPDALDGALKDWNLMSQARREDEQKKQLAKLI